MNQERFRANLNRRIGTRRAGFTLVELLMVIVVIGILSSLLVVASMSVLGTSREAATKATLSKINTLLKQRMAAFEVQLNNDYTKGSHRTDSDFPSVNSLSDPIKKVFYRKRLYKKYFPQTWPEAKAAGIFSNNDLQTNDSNPGLEMEVESAEVLLAVLTKSSITGQGEIGQDAFLSSELADKDSDGLKEIIDGWGNPLRFYRWPCRLIKPSVVGPTYAQPLNNTSPNPEIAAAENVAARTQISALTRDTSYIALNTDPDNPANLDLVNLIQYPQGSPPNMDEYLEGFHIPYTYHTPLIVSAGRDGLFGLESPVDYQIETPMDDPTTTGQNQRQALPEYQTFMDANSMETEAEIEEKRIPLYDNLTNLNALAGGTQ